MSLGRKLSRLAARGFRPSPDTLRHSGPDEAEDSPWDPAPEELEPGPEAPATGDGPTAEEALSDPRRDRIARLRTMMNQVATRQAAKARERAERAAVQLPGARLDTSEGSVRRALEHLGPEHCHGQIAVARALAVDPLSVAGLALDPRLADVDLSQALFLDTETTGLGGGTGVIPFLVGLAWFEDGALVVEQLLLEELDEEPALLAQLYARVEAASCVVTYNGKSYDMPLLDARTVMNRAPPLPERPHLDLLHCSRRVYKPRLRQVRLVDMEAEVLGFRRLHDIDGAEIPSLYWSYLREGRPEFLGPIIEHNAHDVAALAAILAVLAERYAELHREDDPRDQLARAKVGFRSGDLAKAEVFALAAAEGGGSKAVTTEAFEFLGKVRLRTRDLEGARQAFERGVEAALGQASLAAPLHLELAKLFEHRLKAPDLALVHAAHTARAEGPEASAKRSARLQKRCVRRAPRAPPSRHPELAFAREDEKPDA
ncbi:MAG: ribonuclease H-like domain-containing protein [Myxococcota bacterium]